MYKLTVIAGPNRGTSFAVQDGENTIGRQTGNGIILQSSKVSKRHCVLVVSNGEIVVKDQGSSNGTFVNGILTKVKKLKAGDRISVGEYVLELVQAALRTKAPLAAAPQMGNVLQFPMQTTPGGQVATQQPMAQDGSSGVAQDQIPKDLKGRAQWYFEKFAMPFFYGFTLKTEWNVVVISLFALMVLGNLAISIYPQLETSRQTVVKETGRRARFMAKEMVDRNGAALANHLETKTEIGSVESAEGVRVAVLIDMDNRIIAPASKLNQYLTSGVEARVAIKARNAYRSGTKESGFTLEADADTVVAVEPVKVVSTVAGKNVIIGMALVSIDTSISTPDIGEMGVMYSETFVLTAILAGLVLLILYRITLKPFEVLNDEMDKVLNGSLGQVSREFKFKEMNPLWDLINSALARIPKGGASGASASQDPSVFLEEISAPIRMMGATTKAGIIFCDAEQKVLYLNPVFEEISGIRNDNSVGQPFSNVARDQAMAAFISDLFSRAQVGSDGISEDYDFSGVTYKVHVAAFGNTPGQPKAFLVTANRNEG